MAKYKDRLNFQNNNGDYIPVVQDVKANGVSVFDGIEANITMETNYEISVNRQEPPEHLYIPDDDLAWIRINKPKFITVITTEREYIFQLQRASDTTLEYEDLYNLGGYSWYTYYLEINNTDTYQTGCDVLWVSSTTAPSLPINTANKTYVLKCVNGSLRWVEEQ